MAANTRAKNALKALQREKASKRRAASKSVTKRKNAQGKSVGATR